MKIYFNNLQTELNHDYILIYDNAPNVSRLLFNTTGVYGSNTLSYTIRSSKNEIQLVLITDDRVAFQGFQAVYYGSE